MKSSDNFAELHQHRGIIFSAIQSRLTILGGRVEIMSRRSDKRDQLFADMAREEARELLSVIEILFPHTGNELRVQLRDVFRAGMNQTAERLNRYDQHTERSPA